MYCEHCGLQIFPKHPNCTRCGESPTLHWFQLTSLLTLFLAVLCNSAIAMFLLPRFTSSHHGSLYFRIWLWLSEKSAAYGWVPVAVGLLAWDYFVRRKNKHKVKGWVTRKLLTFVLVAGVTHDSVVDSRGSAASELPVCHWSLSWLAECPGLGLCAGDRRHPLLQYGDARGPARQRQSPQLY